MLRKRLDLNGTWQFILDNEDIGWKERWFIKPPEGGKIHDVPVPGVWQEVLPKTHGVGWYFKTFLVPEDFDEGRYEFVFEAADYYVQVWLNGEGLGAHEGGYTPFRLEAGKWLVRGDYNLLTLRVIDPHVDKDPIPGYEPECLPTAKEGGYEPFGGIWGHVWLEKTGDPRVHDVFVIPNLESGEIEAVTQLRHNRQETVPVTVIHEVFDWHPDSLGKPLITQAAECTIEAKGGAKRELRSKIAIPDPKSWSPADPHLYVLRTHLLENNTEIDCVENRFGLRDFSFDGLHFRLNGEPIILKATLQQPDYPIKLARPLDKEMARREIRNALDAGFNMMRLHIKTAPEITIRLADEMGMLLYAEPPIGWIKKSDEMLKRCMHEVQDLVIRDRNSPAVVLWGMLNETGNHEYVMHGGAQDIRKELALEARRLDPTRPIIDDSGGVNCHKERTCVLLPYTTEWREIEDLHIYQRGPADRTILDNYRVAGTPELALFLSEFGFGGMEDLPDVIAEYEKHGDTPWQDKEKVRSILEAIRPGFEERNLKELFGDISGLSRIAQELQAETVKRHVEAIRSNPYLCGYCYTQLSDADHEFAAGIMDRWRRPKPVLHSIAEAQRSTIVVLDIGAGAFETGDNIPLTVRLIHEGIAPASELLIQVELFDSNDERTAMLSWHGRARGPITTWPEIQLPAPQKTGTAKIRVIISGAGFGPVQTERDILVLCPVADENLQARYLAGSALPLDDLPCGDDDTPWVIPPLADTGMAYPLDQISQILMDVYRGDVVVIAQPPQDLSPLLIELAEAVCESKEKAEQAFKYESKDGVGAFLGVYHYIREHRLFAGLPKSGIMREPYKNVVPAETFVDHSDEDPTGALDTKPIAIAAQQYMMSGSPTWWGCDCLVRRFGKGHIVLTHLRLFDHLATDALPRHLLANLLAWVGEKRVEKLEPHSSEIEKRVSQALASLQERIQKEITPWWFIGPFRNDRDTGLDMVYPPERCFDLTASYHGGLGPVHWKQIHARAAQDNIIDLQEASTPPYCYYPRFDSWVGYLRRTFIIETTGKHRLEIAHQDGAKIWLDDNLIYEDRRRSENETIHKHQMDIELSAGEHHVLMKIDKVPGQWRAAFRVITLK